MSTPDLKNKKITENERAVYSNSKRRIKNKALSETRQQVIEGEYKNSY